MIVAMAQDVRVILIKLADRLHNMRTLEYLGRQKQVQKARETLDVYAPLAHRLGIHKLKWELEDLSFQALHPRKYAEIEAMVAERRADREEHVNEAKLVLHKELEKVDIPAEISGRAKHSYSIYDKMAKKGREFNEIYDLTAMRVIVERDRGRGDTRLLRRARPDPRPLEADAGPLQGLRRDAQVQRLSRPAHDRDRPPGEPARDPDPHEGDAQRGRARDRRPLVLPQARREPPARRGMACLGQAAHGVGRGRDRPARVPEGLPDRPLRRRGLRLHAQGRGEVAARRLDADRLRVRRPHRRRPQDGRREGERADRPAPLHPAQRRLRRDPDLEGRPRPIARLDDARPLDARTQQDPPVVLT